MLNKIEIFISIEIEKKENGTFDVVTTRSSMPHIHGGVTSKSKETEIGRANFPNREKAEEEAKKRQEFFQNRLTEK